MGRYGRQESYGHKIVRLDFDGYRISWIVDRYYSRSRLRFPQRFSRWTDETGARRFAERWDVDMPTETKEGGDG